MNLYDPLRARYTKIKQHRSVYHIKKHWLTISFLFGFVIDNFTLLRVDTTGNDIALAAYIVVAMASMALLYAGTAGKISEQYARYAKEWSPFVMQFAFGILLRGMFIFYGRSGSWWASWPFLLIILAIMISNELVRRRAQRLLLNLSMLFVGLFAYLVLIVPVIFGKMGAWIFVLSGLIALGTVSLFVWLLRLVVPNFMRANVRIAAFTIGLIYVIFNFLYFTNIIPPIPLSLKELGIYHNVARLDTGDYSLTYEQGKWYELFKSSDTTYHYQAGDTIYCFASVFAPTRLSTEIFHRWEYYVPADKEWRTYGRFSYNIDGGRENGFRGYTLIEHATAGQWRCTVETDRKQVLGSETFDIVDGPVPQGLVTELR